MKVLKQGETPEGRPIGIAWIHRRDCGCEIYEGLALDQPTPGGKFPFEPFVGGAPCAEHETQMALMLGEMIEMEPSERPAFELARETLEKEIR